jgi:hypothetical protein
MEETISLYEKYLLIKSSDNLDDKIGVLNEIIFENPKLIDYLFNKVDSCFGTHKVYILIMSVNGVDMIKVGYTKQDDVKKRFTEKRYMGSDKILIKRVVRENTLQAKGATEFENELKDYYSNFKINSDLTLPGKNEFYDIRHLNRIVDIYDEKFPNYKNVFGLKSPN